LSDVSGDGTPYYEYYSGSGYTENTDNPGNDDPSQYPPVTTTIAGTSDTCAVIQECANIAGNDNNVYYSFDVHFLESAQIWQCVQFYDPAQSGYFNVANSDVELAYGYTIT